MGEFISQAEFARELDVSRQYVSKLVKLGVLKAKNGKLERSSALKAIAAARDPQKDYVRETNQTRKKNVSIPVKPDVLRLDSNSSYHTAKTVRERYLAAMAKLDYERESAKLVSADEVKVSAFNIARRTRDALLAIPDRLAAILAAENDSRKIYDLLNKELRSVLEDLTGDVKQSL